VTRIRFSSLLAIGLFVGGTPSGGLMARDVINDIRWELNQRIYLAEIGGTWHYTIEEAAGIGEGIGIAWDVSLFDVDEFRVGLEVELEHGLVDPGTNVTDDDPGFTGKIALAHLNKLPDYYLRLLEMELSGAMISAVPGSALFLEGKIRDAAWEYIQASYLEEIGGTWHYTIEEAADIGEGIGIAWSVSPFDVDEFRVGLEVELEHGLVDPDTNVTDDDPAFTGKIALAHLNELPDYYFRLLRMGLRAE